MHAIRFHVPTTVARAIGLTTSAHYPGTDQLSGDVEVTDLPWTQVTAIECSIPTATVIVADIERASDVSSNPGFRANCASAMDAAEMAILDSARSDRLSSIRPERGDRVEPGHAAGRHQTRDQPDHG